MILYSLILFVIHLIKYCDVNIELQICVKISSRTSEPVLYRGHIHVFYNNKKRERNLKMPQKLDIILKHIE